MKNPLNSVWQTLFSRVKLIVGLLMEYIMAVNALNIGVDEDTADFLEEEFYPQTKGGISDSITQNWTEQALECYRLNCDCSNCSISKGNYSFACQMPKVLDILIKSLGQPSPKMRLVK